MDMLGAMETILAPVPRFLGFSSLAASAMTRPWNSEPSVGKN